jgi:hypothetical protein
MNMIPPFTFSAYKLLLVLEQINLIFLAPFANYFTLFFGFHKLHLEICKLCLSIVPIDANGWPSRSASPSEPSRGQGEALSAGRCYLECFTSSAP